MCAGETLLCARAEGGGYGLRHPRRVLPIDFAIRPHATA